MVYDFTILSMTLFIVVATRECAVSAGLVAVLPFVIVALSVLVAVILAKHAILAIATSSMANRMLVGVMLLDVVCGDAAAQ
jgi:hypothetical protein